MTSSTDLQLTILLLGI